MAAVAAAVRIRGTVGSSLVMGWRIVSLACHRVADVAGDRAALAVEPAVLDPLAKRLDRGFLRVVLDGRRLRHRAGVDGDDAPALGENTLDDRLLGRVVQATDVEHRRGGVAVGGGVAVVAVSVAVMRVRAHRYRVFANRSTAASSSSVLCVAVWSSPEASASRTQWLT